jgi:hypothetical protein
MVRDSLSCISYHEANPQFGTNGHRDRVLILSKASQLCLTSVGGSGLGILLPYAEHRNHGSQVHRPPGDFGQVTPPDTPIPRELPQPEIVDGYDKGTGGLDPLRASLSSAVAELPEWASGLGRW